MSLLTQATDLMKATAEASATRRAEWEREYGQILRRANAPQPGDAARLLELLPLVDRTQTDAASDIKALAEYAGLERDIAEAGSKAPALDAARAKALTDYHDADKRRDELHREYMIADNAVNFNQRKNHHPTKLGAIRKAYPHLFPGSTNI